MREWMERFPESERHYSYDAHTIFLRFYPAGELGARAE